MTPFYSRNVRIEWGQCDPAGIVFAPRYQDMFTENTVRVFEAAGLPKLRDMLAAAIFAGFPLIDLSTQFIRPTAYGDDVRIESDAPRFGNSSFVIAHRVMLGDFVCVASEEKRVWTVTSPGGLKAERVPDEIRALFVG